MAYQSTELMFLPLGGTQITCDTSHGFGPVIVGNEAIYCKTLFLKYNKLFQTRILFNVPKLRRENSTKVYILKAQFLIFFGSFHG